jgi:hypothetical protein
VLLGYLLGVLEPFKHPPGGRPAAGFTKRLSVTLEDAWAEALDQLELADARYYSELRQLGVVHHLAQLLETYSGSGSARE